MILLNIEEIILLHTKLIAKTGGLDGIRDLKLLDSALSSAYASFEGKDLYSSIEEKAARLCFAIISNHSFIDGNKRIGILAMLMILNLYNIKIVYTQKELIDLGLSTASGKC